MIDGQARADLLGHSRHVVIVQVAEVTQPVFPGQARPLQYRRPGLAVVVLLVACRVQFVSTSGQGAHIPPGKFRYLALPFSTVFFVELLSQILAWHWPEGHGARDFISIVLNADTVKEKCCPLTKTS